MVDEHSEIVKELQKFSQQAERGQERGDSSFVALKRELGQECLQSAQRELGEKQGAEFDKCYIGMQLAAHKHMLDTLKVFKRHASPDLGKILDDGIATTEDHLMHAKDLMRSLDEKASSTAKADSKD
jgi:predicted outer membrane protein